MKRNYTIILGFFISLSLLSCDLFSQNDVQKEKILIALIRDALANAHYSPKDINNEFSKEVYTDFIENLDPTKRYFTQGDIKEFSKFKTEIDDQIKVESLDFYNLVTNRFLQRLNESNGLQKEILENPFDFTLDETYNLDFKNETFPKSKKDIKNKWKKYYKLNTITRLYDKIESENNIKKDSAIYVVKPFDVLEKEAREAALEAANDYYDRMDDLTQEDWFSLYINTLTSIFDPHTSYFSPKNKKKFDIDMSGKLEGIGARLQKKGEYTKVMELISGGPAWQKGELEVGDIILKVAQGNEEPLDIVGMRLDDAIEYIKGKKGTTVKLTLKKIDGSKKVISIVRDVVEIEETFAKSTTVDYEGKKYGLINLPSFYIDFTTKNFRNSATDMEKEVENLKQEGVEGLIIDLRNNGGGSLKTAIDIAGLFINKGPVVQVKYNSSKPRIDKDTNSKIQWNGPLVVMVNELSASASEIFTAAMQDYNRAVIIGSKQTFGKGTVQNVMDLNRIIRYKKQLGALKITIQKFYRINGGSTQIKGVASDIVVPDKYKYMKIGERDEDNPLAWDKIAPANYKPLHFYENFEEVVQNSRTRIMKDDYFNLINENAKWLKKNQEDKLIHLQLDAFKKDVKKHDEEAKKFAKIKEYKNNLSFKSTTIEEALKVKDSTLEKKRNTWHKNLKKDIYVEEALRVLSQLKVNKTAVAVKG